MTCIYFHTKEENAVVHGSERAYIQKLVGDLFLASLCLSTFESDNKAYQGVESLRDGPKT